MIRSVDIEATAPVYETEVTDRVETALTNLFPDAEVESYPGELLARARSMEHVRELLVDQRILDTAREQFLNNVEGNTITVQLDKQTAYEGRVNFAVGTPDELGEITVQIRVTEPSVEEYIEFIAPPTAE